MKTIAKMTAVALLTVSATAAHAGGFGWGSGGSNYSNGLLNVSPSVDVGGLLNGSPILNGNRTSVLSGILNGNSVADGNRIGNGSSVGNGILGNLLGGNRTSFSERKSTRSFGGKRGGRRHHW